MYDSGDNLAVIEALLDLEAATGEPRFLEAARRTGAWLRDVMAHGEEVGVWAQPMGAPMKAVTVDGNFDNRIAVGRLWFWLPTLDRLAARTDEPGLAALADSTRALLAQAQTTKGGYPDHYDPGYPAVAFDPSRFAAYTSDGAVVADDSLRAALGAVVADDDVAAGQRQWLPDDGPGLSGYLDLADGSAVSPGHEPSHDLVSTSLRAALARRPG
ncbi:MAG: hypothetical protein R2939_17880 [Kofleriaceae bacterium]